MVPVDTTTSPQRIHGGHAADNRGINRHRTRRPHGIAPVAAVSRERGGALGNAGDTASRRERSYRRVVCFAHVMRPIDHDANMARHSRRDANADCAYCGNRFVIG